MQTAPPIYTIIVTDTSGNQYEFEKATNRAWERYENDVGKCRFTIPHNDSKILGTVFEVAKTKIAFYRNGTVVWQGLVAAVEDNLEGTTVYGLDYKETLKWYRVGFDTTYTAQKLGTQIASAIFDTIDALTSAAPGDLFTKGTIEDPYATGTSTDKTITLTTYDEDYYTLLLKLVYYARSNSPSGAWTQNTVFDIAPATSPTFTFLRDVGTDKPNVVLELDGEIVDFSFIQDFRFIHNDVKALTVTSGPAILTSTQTDATSISTHYRHQFSPVHGDMTTQGELDERAKDVLKQDKDQSKTLTLAFAPGLAPFSGYSLGDSIKIRVNRGRVEIDEFMRVVGMIVDVENTGAELTKPILQRKRT